MSNLIHDKTKFFGTKQKTIMILGWGQKNFGNYLKIIIQMTKKKNMIQMLIRKEVTVKKLVLRKRNGKW